MLRHALLCLCLLWPALPVGGQVIVGPGLPAPFNSIQSAINVSTPGQVINVRPGTYSEFITFPGFDIVLQSTGGAGVTFIQPPGTIGGPSLVTFPSGLTTATSLTGFTIRNGGSPNGAGATINGSSPVISSCTFLNNQTLGALPQFGGAILIQGGSPLIQNCVFTGNNSRFGGAIALTVGSPTIQNNTFSGNTTDTNAASPFLGGAIYASGGSMVVSGNIFSGNNGETGGAIAVTAAATASITSNTFTANVATRLEGTNPPDSFGGGAIVCLDSTAPDGAISIVANTFNANVSMDSGGAIRCDAANPAITNNTFNGNIADEFGGAVSIIAASAVLVQSNVMTNFNNARNGGAVSVRNTFLSTPGVLNEPVIQSNTINGNYATNVGGGIYIQSSMALISTNTISTNGHLPLNTGFTAPTTHGGGIAVRSPSQFAISTATKPLIMRNIITGNYASTRGAGIDSEISCPDIVANTVTQNGTTTLTTPGTTLDGGGISTYSGFVVIDSNLVRQNSALLVGGGVTINLVGAGVPLAGTANVVNNIVADNSASSPTVGGIGGGFGIYEAHGGNLTFNGNTVTRNTASVPPFAGVGAGAGEGVFVSGATWPLVPLLANSIIRDNGVPTEFGSGPSFFQIFGSGPLIVQHCDTPPVPSFPSLILQNCIDVDPQFVNIGAGNYHLQLTSPCIGAGSSAIAGTPILDFDGLRRFAAIDMGADDR